MLLSSLGWLISSARTVGRSVTSRRVRVLSAAAMMFALCFARGAGIQAQIATIATVGLTPGWVTFGQVVPKGFALDGLRVGSLPTQTDVKTRWDDGSIRFAVVTVKADAAGDFAVTAGAASGAAFVPAIPTASVTLTIGGDAYVAALPANPSSDKWLSGPNVYEGRSTVAPVSQTNGAHQFLRVNFDTRSYSDGKARVDISVENVLDQVGATTVTYDVTINVGGSNVWSKAAVQHYYLTRWREVFEVGPSPFGSITPDLTPFNQARALPPYLPLVANVVDSVLAADGTPRPTFDILQGGALNNPMWDHAGRPELAPYPDWTARYLVYKNPTQLAFVLANGDLSGSWPFHIREPQGSVTSGVGPDRFISIDQRPTVWLDERANTDPIVTPADRVKGGPMQMHEYGSGVPAPGQSPLGPDIAHQPSIAYAPYLLTGDRYYGEEMGFIANYDLIHTYDGDRVRSDTCATCPKIGRNGVLENNEVRGYGWALRNLVDAAAYSPNAEARAYFSQKVRNNLSWLDDYANSQDPITNPLQILWTGYRPEFGYVSLWEQTYLAFGIDRASAQGFVGGLNHRDAIARMQWRLFTDPAYPRLSDKGCVSLDPNAPPPLRIPCDWSAPYLIAAGQVPVATSWSGFTFFTTMAQIAANTVGNPNLQRPYEGFYGPEARLNLMIGIKNGWAGAQESYDYLFPFIGVNNSACSVAYGGNGSADRPDLACRAGWAIDKYPPVPTPPPPAPVNHAPVVNAIPDQSNRVGDSVNLAVQATDADGNTLVYSATGLPDGLAIDTSTGAIAGTLSAAGDFTVTVRASDGSLFDEKSFSWHVARLNHAPTVTVADQHNEQGETLNVQVHAADPDNDTLVYSASGLPSTLVINAATGVISGVWTAAGDFPVTVSVFDGSASASGSFVWHVARRAQILTPTPGATLTSSAQTFTWDAGVNVTRTKIDIGSAPGLADIYQGPLGTVLMQVVHGLPVDGHPLTVRLSSEINGQLKGTDYPYTAFTFVNHSPVVPPIGTQSGHVGDQVTLKVVATDADNDALTFTAVGLPNGTAIDPNTGVITGTLTTAGDYLVTVNVSDGADIRSVIFSWFVRPVNGAPTVTPIPNQSNTVGDAISLAVQATDPEHDALSYSATGLPGGLSINLTTGLISGTLTAVGDFTLTVTVSDGSHSASASFQWHVAAQTGLVKELKNPGPQQSHAGDTVELQMGVVLNAPITSASIVRLSNDDGRSGSEGRSNRLQFNASNLPPGLRINRETGTIRGHIDNDSAGVYDATVTVREPGGRQLSQTFSWTVLPRERRSGGGQ